MKSRRRNKYGYYPYYLTPCLCFHLLCKEHFVHFGAKGGSTAFILNDTLYTENHNGKRIEIVILTDELNLWQNLLISNNMNSFESKLIGSEDYRLKVQKELSEL